MFQMNGHLSIHHQIGTHLCRVVLVRSVVFVFTGGVVISLVVISIIQGSIILNVIQITAPARNGRNISTTTIESNTNIAIR